MNTKNDTKQASIDLTALAKALKVKSGVQAGTVPIGAPVTYGPTAPLGPYCRTCGLN